MTTLTEAEHRFWRTDERMGRTIYALLSNDVVHPSENDPMIGVMETSELAEDVVNTHNTLLQLYGRRYPQVLESSETPENAPRQDLLRIELNDQEKENLLGYVAWLRDGTELFFDPRSVGKLYRALGGKDG